MSQGRQTRDGAAVRRVQVMLDEITIERAKALGEGNLSIGLRKMARGKKMNEYGKFENWEGLNPFEFRASVRTPRERDDRGRSKVLIPLNSGHQSGHAGPGHPADRALS